MKTVKISGHKFKIDTSDLLYITRAQCDYNLWCEVYKKFTSDSTHGTAKKLVEQTHRTIKILLCDDNAVEKVFGKYANNLMNCQLSIPVIFKEIFAIDAHSIAEKIKAYKPKRSLLWRFFH